MTPRGEEAAASAVQLKQKVVLSRLILDTLQETQTSNNTSPFVLVYFFFVSFSFL
jgi:hypothetical protein